MFQLTIDDAEQMLTNPNEGKVTVSNQVIGPEMHKFGLNVGQTFIYDINPGMTWTIVGFTDKHLAVTNPLYKDIWTANPYDLHKRYNR